MCIDLRPQVKLKVTLVLRSFHHPTPSKMRKTGRCGENHTKEEPSIFPQLLNYIDKLPQIHIEGLCDFRISIEPL